MKGCWIDLNIRDMGNCCRERLKLSRERDNSVIISELYRYPLKGGQGEALQSSALLGTGLPCDRRWLLVDSSGRFVSQREQSILALVRTEVNDRLYFHFRDQTLSLPTQALIEQSRLVTVWNDKVEAWDLGEEAASFFSRILQKPIRLCEAKASGHRLVAEAYTESQRVEYLFADGFPYLIISQESLDLLNEKLMNSGLTAVSMDRFRPNIVIKGWQAHAEDAIQTLCVGRHVRLKLVQNCSRCNVIQIDQKTAVSSEEPLATLARYRKLSGSKIYFGMNAWLLEGEGQEIRLGDSVRVE
jgi:uncharacterized protein YcbX